MKASAEVPAAEAALPPQTLTREPQLGLLPRRPSVPRCTVFGCQRSKRSRRLAVLLLLLSIAAAISVAVSVNVSTTGDEMLPPGSVTGYTAVSAEGSAGQLFWWFCPPRNADPAAPLLLWLQGGPGSSGIQWGLLQINGPLQVREGRLQPRAVAWNERLALLYIDSPIGTGYSYSQNSSYASSGTIVAAHLLQALLDFYARGVWPMGNALFIVGQSYAGAPLGHSPRQRLPIPKAASLAHQESDSAVSAATMLCRSVWQAIMCPLSQTTSWRPTHLSSCTALPWETGWLTLRPRSLSSLR
jgi:hypothetical protein